MNTITIRRRFQFCAGHRVMGHENKCAHLHGHNYVAWVHVAAKELDVIGRVIDFAMVKEIIGEWIDKKWDHGFVLNASDATAIACIKPFSPRGKYTQQRLYLMDDNPTAENMARELATCGQERLDHAHCAVTVVRVDLYETENCMATWKKE